MDSEFFDREGAMNRRATDPVIEMIAHKVTRMETSLDKLTDAITKLAVVEERQQTDRAALERAFTAISKTEERSAELWEKVADKLDAMNKRIDDHAADEQEAIQKFGDRLALVEQSLPETNRLKEWAYEGIKYLAVGGIMYFLLKAGVQIPQ